MAPLGVIPCLSSSAHINSGCHWDGAVSALSNGMDLIDAEDKFIRIRPKLPNIEMQVGGAGFRHQVHWRDPSAEKTAADKIRLESRKGRID